ncbi:MAG TPA: ATP-dependent DNA ligase [Burkholderiales bacterium]|nr:ATP-dependent DNA ligase [Burkholderiales bacterium]
MALLTQIVETSQRVSETSSRLEKTRELAACLRAVAPEEIAVAIAYLSGETCQGKLGVSYASLQDARVAPAASASLQLLEIDRAFAEVAEVKGKGAGGRRTEGLRSLFARATAEEQDFLVRLIVGELRQGALRGLMLEAIASAAGVPPADVRRAAMSAGGLAEVARAALAEGTSGLSQFTIQLMQPVLPMLSQSAESPEEALGKFGTAAFEWKLDGARVQVHKSGDEVRVYTRNLNDVTGRVPEIVEAVRRSPRAKLILDGEAIALRPDGSPRSFQLTMRRFGRKLEVEATRQELPLSVFFFDCLLRDDEALVDRPARERFAALEGAVPRATIIPRIVTADAGAASAFFEDALGRGHEGVVAKALDAPYEAGRRGSGWIKVKRARTLDLVVLAAEWGHGRRRGWLSNLHLGARDPASGGYVMLGKTFKGLTDAMLEWQTEEFQKRRLAEDESDGARTVRLRPEIVVEIAFNEIQESSQYPGGLALRFARVKAYRPDKRPEEADTIDTVRGIYAAQVHSGPLPWR